MAIRGIVSSIDDPNSGAIPSPAFYQDLAAISPSPHHLTIRASVSSDSTTGQVDMDALINSLKGYQSGDFDVWLVMHGGIESRYQDKSLSKLEYEMYMPNAALGWKANPVTGALWGIQDTKAGDMLLNDYINKYSLRIVSILQQLATAGVCPTTIFIWNESGQDGPNLVPGVRPTHGSSLAAEVFGAMLATTAKRISDLNLPVKTILPGSLSCLFKYNTDPAGPWVGGYIKKGLDYMDKYGVDAPYNFHGLCLNLEGDITAAYAKACASALTALIKDYNIGGMAVVGECGLGAAAQQGADFSPTINALDSNFGAWFFMSHTTLVPSATTGYGTTTFTISPQGLIVPTGHTWWYDQLVKEIAALPN